MNPILTKLVEIFDAQKSDNGRGAVLDFETRSGFNRQVISYWRRRKNGGNIDTVCAVANTLGYRLVLEKIEEGEAA